LVLGIIVTDPTFGRDLELLRSDISSWYGLSGQCDTVFTLTEMT